MKNSSDTIGNRTRDLPACGALPQPTAPPRTPINRVQRRINMFLVETPLIVLRGMTG